MVTRKSQHSPIYTPGSIQDRLSQLTPKQNREYMKLRDEGLPIKEAIDRVRPQVDQPCSYCHWKEEADPRCRRCRGTGRMPLQAQLVMVTSWEEEIIK
jgi:hypothetical protein